MITDMWSEYTPASIVFYFLFEQGVDIQKIRRRKDPVGGLFCMSVYRVVSRQTGVVWT